MILPTLARYQPRRLVIVVVLSVMVIVLLIANQHLKTYVAVIVSGIARGAPKSSHISNSEWKTSTLRRQQEDAVLLKKQTTNTPRGSRKHTPRPEKQTTKSTKRRQFKAGQTTISRTEMVTEGDSEWQTTKSLKVIGKQTPTIKLQKQMAEEHLEDVASIFEQRRAVYESVCRQWKEKEGREVEGGVRPPYVYLPGNITFCRVPKVGVTFWKRVFFYLFKTGVNKKTSNKTVTSPMDIDRLYVHQHSPGKENTANIKTAEGSSLLFKTKRIMFARDPWSRLWSAYVDKFVLPDSWLDIGRTVVAMREKLSAERAARLKVQSEFEKQALGDVGRYRVNKTKLFKCADDITFAESLHYALSTKPNAHWAPQHRVCNPCIYRPTYLGQLETFSRDSNFILNSAGLGDLIQDQKDHESHVQDELQLLTAYHYQLWKERPKLHACLDKVGLARRLWAAFQLNGYIPLDSPFPAQKMTSQMRDVTWEEAQERVTKQVMEAHAGSTLDHSKWSAFRRKVMVAAYRSVPRDMLFGIQETFKLDFQLFQYDTQPNDIFKE